MILQGMLQGFLNVTVFSMTPQQAVEAPRVVAFGWPDSFHPHRTPPAAVALEGRFDESVSAWLERVGHKSWNGTTSLSTQGGWRLRWMRRPRQADVSSPPALIRDALATRWADNRKTAT